MFIDKGGTEGGRAPPAPAGPHALASIMASIIRALLVMAVVRKMNLHPEGERTRQCPASPGRAVGQSGHGRARQEGPWILPPPSPLALATTNTEHGPCSALCRDCWVPRALACSLPLSRQQQPPPPPPCCSSYLSPSPETEERQFLRRCSPPGRRQG